MTSQDHCELGSLELSLWPAHHWILILIILVMCAQLSKFLVGALIKVGSAFPRASRRHNVRRHSQMEQLSHGCWLGCGHHGGVMAGSGLEHCACIYSCLSISENLLSCISRKKVWSSVFLDGVSYWAIHFFDQPEIFLAHWEFARGSSYMCL